MQSYHVFSSTTPAIDPCYLFSSSSHPTHNFQPFSIPIFRTQLPKLKSLRVKSFTASAHYKQPNESFISEEQSFYDVLGIPENGSLVEIKQAYREMARKYHPDVSPPDRVEEYTQWFIRVQEAYETLSDPYRRALYDRDLAKGLHLAFSVRRNWQFDEGLGGKSEWKSHWQSQVSELKRRSADRDARGNMSWGARMRRQRGGSHGEL